MTANVTVLKTLQALTHNYIPILQKRNNNHDFEVFTLKQIPGKFIHVGLAFMTSEELRTETRIKMSTVS